MPKKTTKNNLNTFLIKSKILEKDKKYEYQKVILKSILENIETHILETHKIYVNDYDYKSFSKIFTKFQFWVSQVN